MLVIILKKLSKIPRIIINIDPNSNLNEKLLSCLSLSNCNNDFDL